MNSLGKTWPCVNQNTLIILAGMVWVGVGIMLNSKAIGWLSNYHGNFLWGFVFTGIVIGILKGKYVFQKLVQKNIKRIASFTENKWILFFIPLRTYFLIIIMMFLGYLLRHSIIPKEFLAILYIGIGLALILSGMQYFFVLHKLKTVSVE